MLLTRVAPRRDLSTVTSGAPLTSVGSLAEHSRPVESLDARATSATSAVLYTGDTMGIIKVWDVQKDTGVPPRWNSTLVEELKHHRTRVNAMALGNSELWTGNAAPAGTHLAHMLTRVISCAQRLLTTPCRSSRARRSAPPPPPRPRQKHPP